MFALQAIRISINSFYIFHVKAGQKKEKGKEKEREEREDGKFQRM